MGRKKNLKDIDELEMEFIEKKMNGDSALNYLTSCGYATHLKALSFKLEIKCKNERQKEFVQPVKGKMKVESGRFVILESGRTAATIDLAKGKII